MFCILSARVNIVAIQQPKLLRQAWHLQCLYHPRECAVGPDGVIVRSNSPYVSLVLIGRDACVTTCETWDMRSTCRVSPNTENQLKKLYRILLEHPRLKEVVLF